MGNMWGTSEWVPHTETLVNKGIGGMGRSFLKYTANTETGTANTELA